jgi:maleamate amidohydrolase
MRQQISLKTFTSAQADYRLPEPFANLAWRNFHLAALGSKRQYCSSSERAATGVSKAMSEPIWNKFLTERDRTVFAASGYGRRGGFGRRPALLVVDVNYAFCDERPVPILESIKRWRNSCGEDAWIAMPYVKSLIEKCHEKGVPVIYTTGVRREDNWDNGSWSWKNDRSADETTGKRATNVDGNAIVAEIAPAPQDIVVLKQKPSGFFGTNMTSYLTLLGCDSVIVTGTTTSGCVRATVLDAFSLNYRIALAEEGCFDRSQASHAINLCDMNAKYADVLKTAEVLAFFDSLPSGMYDLPKSSVAPVPKPKLAAKS